LAVIAKLLSLWDVSSFIPQVLALIITLCLCALFTQPVNHCCSLAGNMPATVTKLFHSGRAAQRKTAAEAREAKKAEKAKAAERKRGMKRKNRNADSDRSVLIFV
jgi:hypothetical protein